MAGNEQRSDGWVECSAGELQNLVCELRAQRHRRVSRRALGAVTGIALVVLAGFVVQRVSDSAPYQPDHFACHDVQPLLADFVSGNIDSDLALRIRHHLENCPHCETIYERLLALAGQTTFVEFPRCRCSHCLERPAISAQLAYSRAGASRSDS